jgi:hypothetical protein
LLGRRRWRGSKREKGKGKRDKGQVIRERQKRSTDMSVKKDTKKKGTLRPWLVDVSLDHLR